MEKSWLGYNIVLLVGSVRVLARCRQIGREK